MINSFKYDWNYWMWIAIIVVGAWLLGWLLRKLINAIIERNSKILNIDPTNFSFIKNSVTFVIYTVAIILVFYITPALKDVGTALFASAGILAAILGFASQKAFANIISGIFVLMFKPFRVGDIIQVGMDQKGIVEEITLRHTVIKDYENRRIIIPNSIISDETITNSSITEEKIKKFIEFDISYESDIDIAKKIIVNNIENNSNFLDNRDQSDKDKGNPKVPIRVIALEEFSVKLRAYAWARNNDEAFALRCEVFESVKKEFDKNNIEIPYPHRTIVYKNNNHESCNNI